MSSKFKSHTKTSTSVAWKNQDGAFLSLRVKRSNAFYQQVFKFSSYEDAVAVQRVVNAADYGKIRSFVAVKRADGDVVTFSNGKSGVFVANYRKASKSREAVLL